MAAALAAAVPLRSGAEEFDWKKTLEAPLSPGTMAALVEHPDEASVQDRWRAGLNDANPDVRTAAARAVYAAGARSLLPTLKDALAHEEDPAAAGEEIRAIVAVGSAADDAVVMDAARRLPPLRVMTWIHLGLARGLDALAYLPAARDMDTESQDRRALVRAATHGGREGINAAAEVALRENDGEAWFVIWEGTSMGGRLEDRFILQSVSAPSPRIRATTYWYLALLVGNGVKLPSALAKAIASCPEAALDAKKPPVDAAVREALLAYGLLRRAGGGKRHEDVEWARGVPKGDNPWPFPGPIKPMAVWFSPDERRALMAAGHLGPEPEHIIAAAWRPARFAGSSSGRRTLRIDEFPRGYVSGLAGLTGCRDASLSANVTYDREGRPQTVAVLDADALATGCRTTAAVLFASHPFSRFMSANDVRGTQAEPGTATASIAFLDAASLAWDEKREGPRPGAGPGGVVAPGVIGPDGAVHVGGTIKEPKKLKNVVPLYPRKARDARVTGRVIIEALIDPDGHVSDTRVLSGIPLLDQAAVDAVRQWVYTPTLLNGKAVPVIMTVTVTFDLR
jgi:TonB family protein